MNLIVQLKTEKSPVHTKVSDKYFKDFMTRVFFNDKDFIATDDAMFFKSEIVYVKEQN